MEKNLKGYTIFKVQNFQKIEKNLFNKSKISIDIVVDIKKNL